MHSVVPDAAYCPTEQSLHNPICLTAVVIFPAAQSAHAVAGLESSSMVPATQSTHAEISLAPEVEDDLPASHSMQDVLPLLELGENLPVVHLVHAVLPEYVAY